MQAGNPFAQRRGISEKVATYPSMGSVAAKFRGPNHAALPAFVGLADPPLWFADVLGAGPLGGRYEPARGDEMANRLTLPQGIDVARAKGRVAMSRRFDGLRRDLDAGDTMDR